MIYIIDDKRSRQQDYGWDDEHFSQYKEAITPIWNMESLEAYRDKMLEDDNVILFHESFLASDDEERNSRINALKTDLDHASTLYLSYFSGSKNGRFVDDRRCMLPPDVLYTNLTKFINKLQEGDTDFKYLAFGENYQLEESIRNRLEKVNNANVGSEKIPIDKKILFYVTSEDEIEPPFKIDVTKDWDFFGEDVSDRDLDTIVTKWLSNIKYDSIYIPLYFGNVYSDYMGLRLAMHIRLTETIHNQHTPIFIYGVSTYEEVSDNECFEVFKFSDVFLINADNRSLEQSLTIHVPSINNSKEIDRILLNVPSNIGDNHSVANRWAMFRWCDMLKWPSDTPAISASGLEESLYFKYLVAKFGEHDKFSNKHKYDIKINGIEGKTILYIDDEYDKGWDSILHTIFENSKAKFLCYKSFDKKLTRKELIERIQEYLNKNEADCYLIDLRLHEDDFKEGQRHNLTGHEIAKYIKELNAGNQIVVFTASNKIWNLKEEVFKIGASGYAMKESPNLNLKRQESLELYIEFVKAIQQACEMSYLKEIINEQNRLKEILPSISQLDSIVNLLSRDQGNNDQDLLGAALLAEIVFIEDYIKNQLGYELRTEGKDSTMKVFLYSKSNANYKEELVTGRIFFKRTQNGSYTTVTDVSTEAQSGWCNITGSDISLVTSVLMMIFELPRIEVKKYVDMKYIRNTQIAHRSDDKTKIQEIKSDIIVDFYKRVICPIVESGHEQ